jgi:hypothetical protein
MEPYYITCSCWERVALPTAPAVQAQAVAAMKSFAEVLQDIPCRRVPWRLPNPRRIGDQSATLGVQARDLTGGMEL